MNNPAPPPAGPPAGGPQPPPMEMPDGLPIEYANLVRISHSISEIVLDFAQLLPGMPAARIESRILMSPLSAKLLNRALGENLARYEAAFGEINIPGGLSLADHLFRPPAPPPQK